MYKYRAMYDYVDFYGHHDAAARERAKHVPKAGSLAAMAARAVDDGDRPEAADAGPKSRTDSTDS